MTVMQNIVCMKWGNRYSADYANRLYSMIKRNTKQSFRLICYTDDSKGLIPQIEVFPLPTINLPKSHASKPWRKISLWAKTLPGLSGNALFLDLDLVITGSVDAFFEFKPEANFCVIENWTQYGSGIGNTSVYRFRVGANPDIYNKLQNDPENILNSFSNSQTYVSRSILQKEFWPAEWCVSFKHNLLPRWPLNFFKTAESPPQTKVVAFTGHPDPDEALEGQWKTRWYKKLYKHVRPTPWIAEHWQ